MHSHYYRVPDPFKNETVLIIGAGPSGKDIALEIATRAKHVILSHHRDLKGFILPSNVKQVGDVQRIRTNSVQFTNGEELRITSILFCTGVIISSNSLNLYVLNSKIYSIFSKCRLYIFISIPFGGLWTMCKRQVFGASTLQACNQYKSQHHGNYWNANMRVYAHV